MWPFGKLLYEKVYQSPAIVCGSAVIVYGSVAILCGSATVVWPSVSIVFASANDWLLTKLGTTQIRDSVTPALLLTFYFLWHFLHNTDGCIFAKTTGLINYIFIQDTSVVFTVSMKFAINRTIFVLGLHLNLHFLKCIWFFFCKY